MSVNINFAGKRILITGGGRGIGRALVKKFYDGNAVVYTVDKDEEALKKLKTEFPNLTYAVVDLSDWDATQSVIETFGNMDHLVNNAGIIILESFLETTKESLDKQFNVNYRAMVNVGQVVVKGMIASKTEAASIVNVSSIADRSTACGAGIYGATKAAVTALTKNMAVELGQYNIRVNCVCPGVVNTPMVIGDIPLEAAGPFLTKAVIKRYIDPLEIADLICFLLSPLAGMVTGSSVVVDAGITCT